MTIGVKTGGGVGKSAVNAGFDVQRAACAKYSLPSTENKRALFGEIIVSSSIFDSYSFEETARLTPVMQFGYHPERHGKSRTAILEVSSCSPAHRSDRPRVRNVTASMATRTAQLLVLDRLSVPIEIVAWFVLLQGFEGRLVRSVEPGADGLRAETTALEQPIDDLTCASRIAATDSDPNTSSGIIRVRHR